MCNFIQTRQSVLFQFVEQSTRISRNRNTEDSNFVDFIELQYEFNLLQQKSSTCEQNLSHEAKF